MTLIIKRIANSSLQFSLQKWQLSLFVLYRWFKSVTICQFSFVSSFAETKTSANKRKPVYLAVRAEFPFFLCKPSLQKTQLNK